MDDTRSRDGYLEKYSLLVTVLEVHSIRTGAGRGRDVKDRVLSAGGWGAKEEGKKKEEEKMKN